MRHQDYPLAQQLWQGLDLFSQQVRSLQGINNPAYRDSLIEQFVESIRRIRYVTLISKRSVCDDRADPSSELFDPEKAAVLRHRQGANDEAFWMVFLSVHFGKPRKSGWRLVRDIYGRLGDGGYWDWATTSAAPGAFRH